MGSRKYTCHASRRRQSYTPGLSRAGKQTLFSISKNDLHKARLERRTSMTEPIYFDGISLPVSDVDRSVAFYQQFGFQLEIRHDDFALLRLGEGTIGLLKMD